MIKCGSSSVGRATAFQAVGRGFEPRLPLKIWSDSLLPIKIGIGRVRQLADRLSLNRAVIASAGWRIVFRSLDFELCF